jgi:hypothetical protein
VATLSVSPTRVRANQTKVITFVGSGTAWGAPTFTPSGVVGVSCGAVTVLSATTATAPVTYGANPGTVTWTDSTTGATTHQLIGGRITPLWAPHRPYR